MRVTCDQRDGAFEFRLRLDAEESLRGSGQLDRAISLLTDRWHVTLPSEVSSLHPDLLAAAVWLVVEPWVVDHITFPEPISSALAERIAATWRVEVTAVDDHLPARQPGSVGALAYSSGADSVAASLPSDPDTPHVFHRRVSHPRVPDRADHVTAGVTETLVRRAGERGRRVLIATSDLEYLVAPWPALPSWPSLAVGAVLMADDLDLGSLGFGTVFGSRFLRHGYRFNAARSQGAWGSLLAQVGLPVSRPTTALTEVTTSRLAFGSDLADLVRSCAMGTLDGPCNACIKCLRKDLILAALEERPIDRSILARLSPTDPVVRELHGTGPYHFQHVLEFGVLHARGLDGTVLADIAERVMATPAQSSWVRRAYRPALDLEVPSAHQQRVTAAIEREVGWMSDDEVRLVQTWDASTRLAPALDTPPMTT